MRGALQAALLLSVALLSQGCEQSSPGAFVYSSDAASRTGLLETPQGNLLGNEAGRVVLLRPDGSVAWSTQLGHEIAARPALSGTIVIAATVNGDWVGLSLEAGRVLWQSPLGTPVYAPLLADAARAYGVTQTGEVRAVWVSDGSPAWNQAAPASSQLHTERRATAWPALVHPGRKPSSERLLVGYQNVGLVALSPETGQPLWKTSQRSLTGFTADGAQLYTTTAAGKVEAFRSDDGEKIWSHDVGPSSGPPSVALGRVWLPLEARQLVALDPTSGEERSRLPVPGRVTAQLASSSESLWVPDSGPEGQLWGLRPADGRRLSTRIDSPLRTQPLVAHGEIWALSADGRVTAVRLEGELDRPEPGLLAPTRQGPAISVRAARETGGWED